MKRSRSGLKQILPDPWQHIDQFYAVGDEVEGTVTRLVPFGAFVALDHGIEGIIPNGELADHRIRKPEDVVATNQKVHVRIINIRPTERRMTLSLRQTAQPDEEEAVSTYARRASGSSMTIGEMIGDVFAAEEEVEENTMLPEEQEISASPTKEMKRDVDEQELTNRQRTPMSSMRGADAHPREQHPGSANCPI